MTVREGAASARRLAREAGGDKFTDDGRLRTGDVVHMNERGACASAIEPRIS